MIRSPAYFILFYIVCNYMVTFSQYDDENQNF
ncbi:hypothetical protein AvCA_25700 [Azotobacter vinelandii CA]|uniref:Uncharacterized protein n=2 Tax=Azotobacter vinelandii TaxID=354 RepID=C1DIR9_AZOVD|nr:hypothetical protein Avin_25700 [Azotobacter vinelandii DJ]AGK14919.1 hypothetical protein AvCA_25700 [Azotobacter vinelandii CA]AGK20715.1 hypothetical protein AvCA6_25700 [Azotobacter vinelandii CA6]